MVSIPHPGPRSGEPEGHPEPDHAPTVDVAVVGGGPAGASAARLLAGWGYEVVLLAGPPRRRPAHAESLPPSAWKLIDVLGLRSGVECAGFLPCRGNLVAWEGGALEARPFPGDQVGLQVVRDRLDALLLEGARQAGARVVDGAAVLRVTPPPGGEADRGCVAHWKGPEGSGVTRARWLLDASGRAGVVARRGFRHRQGGPSTTALLGVWRNPGGWSTEVGEGEAQGFPTLVESYRDGWAWSVPAPGGLRYVAAMVDPRLTSVARGPVLERAYREQLGRTTHIRRLLEGAQLASPPWACAATGYGARDHGVDGVLLLGDAGSFLDPLSSYGVKKALASGWLAAVVAHTALRDPGRTGAALALYQERESTAHASSRAQAASFYRESAQRWGHPFWNSRAGAVDDPTPVDGSRGILDADPDPARVLADPRVTAAFESLRRTEALDLRPAPGMRRVPRPLVRGREVVLEDHLVTPSAPGGIRFLRGVDLATLVDLVGEHRAVPDLFHAYGRADRPVRLPDFLGALSILLGLGMIEAAGPT